MLNFERLNHVMQEELGECGYEAIQSAIEFYLGNCPSDYWSCEEDKLILLMYLFSCSGTYTADEFNPLMHFSISFDCAYSSDQEAE